MKQIRNQSQTLRRIGRFAVGAMLALAMVLGLLPGMTRTAKAAIGNGQLYVAGVDIVAIGGTVNSSTTGIIGTVSGSAVLTNGDNPVLTLTNFKYNDVSVKTTFQLTPKAPEIISFAP